MTETNSQRRLGSPALHADGQTLRSLILTAVDRFPDRPALTVADATVNYRDLIADANRLAHALVERGVTPGTPVVLLMPNSVEYVVADQAILRCGAAKVPINPALAALEIQFILRDCAAPVAIVADEMADVVATAGIATLRHVIVTGATPAPEEFERWQEVLAGQPDDEPPPIYVEEFDAALIAYTGGTTGRQKGVVHTQRGLRDNLLAHVIEMGLLDDERLLLTTPLPHSAGFLLQAAMLKGAHTLLERRFEPVAVLERIERDRITFLFMVPTMIYRLLDSAHGSSHDLTSLRTILYGAAPITVDRLREGIHRFGPVFMQLYGQTEAPNFLTRLSREDHDPLRPDRLASCGRSATLAEIKIVDTDGRVAPPGQPGEVCARAPYVMARYLGLPEKTAEALRDGWLHTGDVGTVDVDGYLYLLDRKNDMIITGGLNVYSSEVENVLTSVAGIRQVAVVGIPHPDWGEAVTAFVVPSESGFDEAAADRACRVALAGYKRPKEYVAIDTLPVTPFGKIDKKRLRTDHSAP